MKALKHLVLAGLVLGAASVAAQSAPRVSGSVTYREKMVLPPSAVLEIRLEDVSRAEAAPPIVAARQIEHPGQVPVRFELPYDAQMIEARGRYAVRASIKDGDIVLFTSRDTVLVLTQGHGVHADLVLTHVGNPAPAPKPPVAVTKPAPPPPAPRPQPNPLPALPATFTGSYTCADCPKKEYQLNLYPDDSFFMRSTVTGRQTTGRTDDIGSWVLSSDRTVLVLKGQGDSLDMFTIGPNGSLKKLDGSAIPLPGHLPNELAHAAAFKPLTADLPTMRGAYSMADRAAFVECSTGQRWMVADEGAAAELEAAYLKARSAPGASVLVEIEGVASPGTGRDGGSGASVTVRKLKRMLPRESCDARYAGASLTNTPWRLTNLGAQAAAAASDPRREQSLIFEASDMSSSGSYSGSSGCNRLVGTYSTTDDAMTLTAGGTLVACKELAQAESAFLNALKATRRYRISGQVLELFDAAGARVARFAAQMPAGAVKR